MAEGYGAKKFALAAVTGGGGCAAIANPEGVDLIITDLILDITTKATAACTLDAGVASGATTSADNLIDGVDANAAVVVANNVKHAGTNGLGCKKWGASEYLTVSEKTGAIAGLVGNGYVKYIRK